MSQSTNLNLEAIPNDPVLEARLDVTMHDNWRNWISARVQALKRDNPSCSKKDCWRIASKEWGELRRQFK